jgi:hypothetical protein
MPQRPSRQRLSSNAVAFAIQLSKTSAHTIVEAVQATACGSLLLFLNTSPNLPITAEILDLYLFVP